ncbi:50S ribosomal protein L18 [Candidatus Kuenenbacteria bacterium HGW-Kuenenbacteria-1]|uniref:Large ribosomal subunit protein uL18 n=1 Tax=Candidatus Kuenenbacteria bacterium HGW-Kuenenbacteria-1 TaxID=2013812 RepID=A0A2N1UNE4_9BACT|nr:MAG: 50S ribosomal protein L18 [Candidatus Kuenenbacteria bacterium HGW-Kuenenbacteria-1]
MKNQQKIKQEKRIRRHKRIRTKIKGTNERPRLSVFRSNKQIYAQLIDDKKGFTLVAADGREIEKAKTEKQEVQKKEKEDELSVGVVVAYEVGKLIAQKALKNKIDQAVFDRGGYKYHGQVKAVADGAREGGLKF